MRQRIRIFRSSHRGHALRRIALAGVSLGATAAFALPSGCGGRSIGDYDFGAGTAGSSTDGRGGGSTTGSGGSAPVGSGGTRPSAVGGTGPSAFGGTGPSAAGGTGPSAVGGGPSPAGGASGAFGASGFGGTAGAAGASGSASTCNPSFCPSDGRGTPCCLRSGVCSIDLGSGCGNPPPLCDPRSCQSPSGLLACCVGSRGPCGERANENEVCRPLGARLCNPLFCPNPGVGQPCCITPDGPCGLDTGMGCQNIFDAGPAF